MPRLRIPTFRRRSPDVLRLVAAELGPEIVPGGSLAGDGIDEALLDELEVPALLASLASEPGPRWPAAIHAFYEPRRDLLRRGADLVRRTPTFEAARDLLRLQWGDDADDPAWLVSRPGPGPATSERLVLDDPSVRRVVTRRHLARWGVPPEEAFASAEAHAMANVPTPVLEPRLPGAFDLVFADPLGMGVVARRLGEVDPRLVGRFGSLVSRIGPNHLVALPLSASAGLPYTANALLVGPFVRGTHNMGRPLWRLPDGELRAAEVHVDREAERLLPEVVDGRLEGVLAYLDPVRHVVEVPAWAGDVDRLAWTRFAGLVAARGVGADEASRAALLARLRDVDPETWPDLVRDEGATTAPIPRGD